MEEFKPADDFVTGCQWLWRIWTFEAFGTAWMDKKEWFHIFGPFYYQKGNRDD